MQYGTDRRQQLEELKRELKLRKRVYPKWVAAGRLSQADMQHRINCLSAVIDDFEERHNPTAKQGELGL